MYFFYYLNYIIYECRLAGQRDPSMNIPTIQTEERPNLTQRISDEESGSPIKGRKKILVISNYLLCLDYNLSL